MSGFYDTAVHVLPEVWSDERMHILDDTCWCRPWIDATARQIRHNSEAPSHPQDSQTAREALGGSDG